MGIENLIKGLIPGISDEKAQQAIQALRSGKMSDKEAQELGFTSEVQAKINEYFAKNGEAQIGDYVLFGLGDDPQDQNYFMTQTAVRKYIKVPDSAYYAVYERNENTREVSVKFYSPMGQEIRDDVDGNGKVTKTAEQKFAELTNLNLNGKYGVKDGLLVEIKDDEESSGMSAGATIAATTGAGALAGGIGGATFMGIGAVPGAVIGGIGGLVTGIMSSCTTENTYNIEPAAIYVTVNSNQEVVAKLDLNADLATLKATLEAILQELKDAKGIAQETLNAIKQVILNQIKQGATLEAILAAIGDNDKLLAEILKAVTQGNQLLQNLKGLMEDNNATNKKILETELAILQMLSKFPNLEGQLNAILNAIKNLQGGDSGEVLAMLEEVIRLLKNIDKSTAATEETTRKILAAIQKLGADQAANFALLIEAINNNYGGHGPDYTNLLNLILAKLDTIDQHNQAGYEALLNKMDEILQAIKDHHVTVDVTGTVTCNCNCGNNGSHEGILDEINSLIS